MNVQSLNVTKEAAQQAVREYRQHRSVYDAKDWEIEKVYRQIARGKTVISVVDAILAAGVDFMTRLPKLAIARADCERVRYILSGRVGTFGVANWGGGRWKIEVPGMAPALGWVNGYAILPRIPPQHRPPARSLKSYYILWEADWTAIPRDPYLLKRIGKDAWVVLAAWDLTDVEVSVLRAHRTQ